VESGGGLKALDALEGREQHAAPRPVVLEADEHPATAAYDAGSAVEEAVAEGAGLPELGLTLEPDAAEVAEGRFDTLTQDQLSAI
jgi:hypothetical protein